jgi:hypothetical protein
LGQHRLDGHRRRTVVIIVCLRTEPTKGDLASASLQQRRATMNKVLLSVNSADGKSTITFTADFENLEDAVELHAKISEIVRAHTNRLTASPPNWGQKLLGQS